MWQTLLTYVRRLIGRQPAVVAAPIVEAAVEVVADAAADVVVEAAPVRPRKPRKTLAPLRREIADAVSDIIEQITGFDMPHIAERHAGREFEEALGHLYGCDFHYVNELMEKMNGGSQWRALEPDNDMRELIWPIDIATVVKRDWGGLEFCRMFTATPASLRGRAKIVPARAAWLASAAVEPDGKWFAQMSPVGLIGGKWVALDEGLARDAKFTPRGALEARAHHDRDEVNDTCSITQSVALTERYSWHVAIGQTNGPRVLLPTNPHGCLELFKTRERRDGERRAALRHWVANHFRERGDREIAYVRDHLRGSTAFDWQGFGCEIFVSEYDLEMNELFRLQAAEWRARRKHNRVNVRLKRA
jgi:hypothetical protein